MTRLRDEPVLFFGNATENAGHHMYRSFRDGDRRIEDQVFFTFPRAQMPERLQTPDGVFCPRDHRRDGVCRILFVEGWTILSYWDDSSADGRPGCNSSFISFGRRPFAEMLGLAMASFPAIVGRRRSGLVLEGPDVAATGRCAACEAGIGLVRDPAQWTVNGVPCCDGHVLAGLRRDADNVVRAVG